MLTSGFCGDIICGMKGGFAMTKLHIINREDASLDVDVQEERDGRWVSRGVKRVFKGEGLDVEGSGHLRVMFNGEKLITTAPTRTASKRGKEEKEEEPSE